MIKLNLVCGLLLALATTTSLAEKLRVAAAANYYHTLKKISAEYERETGTKIEIIRGSTGKLYAQIIHGAPFDLYFAADARRPDELVRNKRASRDDAKVYATGQIALWRPDAVSSQELLELLRSGEFNKLAIANPKTAPYGAAAIESLKAMELYAEFRDKLVYAENIAQAVQFVQAGAADIGIVAKSYVNHDVHYAIDTYYHKPIEQKVVILKQSSNYVEAKRFYEFLDSERARQIAIEDGYIK